MNPTKAKTRVRDRRYGQLREVWLGHRCQARLPGCGGLATDVEHMAGRVGSNMLNVATWLGVCRACHDWLGANPRKAEEKGMRMKRTVNHPSRNQLARCQACDDHIWWAWTTDAVSIPLVADESGPVHRPDWEGITWQEHHRQASLDPGEEVIVVEETLEPDPDLPWWVSHLDVCTGRFR